MIRQVVCHPLWERGVECSIHSSRTMFGGLTEWLKVPDCKSGLNSTLVRIQQPPPFSSNGSTGTLVAHQCERHRVLRGEDASLRDTNFMGM